MLEDAFYTGEILNVIQITVSGSFNTIEYKLTHFFKLVDQNYSSHALTSWIDFCNFLKPHILKD